LSKYAPLCSHLPLRARAVNPAYISVIRRRAVEANPLLLRAVARNRGVTVRVIYLSLSLSLSLSLFLSLRCPTRPRRTPTRRYASCAPATSMMSVC